MYTYYFVDKPSVFTKNIRHKTILFLYKQEWLWHNLTMFLSEIRTTEQTALNK